MADGVPGTSLSSRRTPPGLTDVPAAWAGPRRRRTPPHGGALGRVGAGTGLRGSGRVSGAGARDPGSVVETGHAIAPAGASWRGIDGTPAPVHAHMVQW
jgi:hypothetical protein